MGHEKQNGRAEIEERALVLRETTRHKDRVAKLLEECIVFHNGKKRCDTDKVGPMWKSTYEPGLLLSKHYTITVYVLFYWDIGPKDNEQDFLMGLLGFFLDNLIEYQNVKTDDHRKRKNTTSNDEMS